MVTDIELKIDKMPHSLSLLDVMRSLTRFIYFEIVYKDRWMAALNFFWLGTTFALPLFKLIILIFEWGHGIANLYNSSRRPVW